MSRGRGATGFVVVVCLAIAGLVGCSSKSSHTALRTALDGVATVVPDSAVALMTSSLRPAADEQKRFDDIAHNVLKMPLKAPFEENRDLLLSDEARSLKLDYRTEMLPWIGSDISEAVLPTDAKPSRITVLAIKSGNASAARKAFAAASRRHGFKTVYRITDRFVAYAPADVGVTAQSLVPATPLSSKDSFRSVRSNLAADGLTLLWFESGDALKSDAGQQLLTQAGVAGFDPSTLHLNGPSVLSMSAGQRSLRADGYSASSGLKGGTPTLIANLPASTRAVITLFDPRPASDFLLDQFVPKQPQLSRLIERIHTVTGLDLKQDVLSWLDGESAAVIGPPAARVTGQPLPDFAVVGTPVDMAKAQQGIEKIKAALATTGAPFVSQQLDGFSLWVSPQPDKNGLRTTFGLLGGKFVFGSSPSYVVSMVKPGGEVLGQSAVYKRSLQRLAGQPQIEVLMRLDQMRNDGFSLDDILNPSQSSPTTTTPGAPATTTTIAGTSTVSAGPGALGLFTTRLLAGAMWNTLSVEARRDGSASRFLIELAG